jgi:hypothetical protein
VSQFVARRVVSLRCNDSSAIEGKSNSGSHSDRPNYEFAALSMIRKSGYRFSLATNAERVCAEIMLKQDEIMIRFNLIGELAIAR